MMENKIELTSLTIQMKIEDYKIIKKMAVDQNITLKKLVIKALAEYAARNGKI